MFEHKLINIAGEMFNLGYIYKYIPGDNVNTKKDLWKRETGFSLQQKAVWLLQLPTRGRLWATFGFLVREKFKLFGANE